MTKKDYQAIARALYTIRTDALCTLGGIAEQSRDIWLGHVESRLADIFAADNPRFDRETFVAACEDGNVMRQPRTVHKAKPLCVQAMGCYCAGHARGNSVYASCDTRE